MDAECISWIRLPDLANKNTACRFKFEFGINGE